MSILATSIAIAAPALWLLLLTSAPRPWRWAVAGVVAFAAVALLWAAGIVYAPLVEEAAKAAAIWRWASARRGAATGAGFALVENLAYLTVTASPMVMLIRGLGAVPLHVVTTATSGAGLARGRWWAAAGVAAAMAMHAVFNALI